MDLIGKTLITSVNYIKNDLPIHCDCMQLWNGVFYKDYSTEINILTTFLNSF